MRITSIFLLLFFLGSYYTHAQYTETINSNRPGNSQGAFAVGTGVLQLEVGAKFGKDEHSLLFTSTDLWGVDYTLRYGFYLPQLEINLNGSFLSSTINYQLVGADRTYEIRNFKFNTIGLKYLLFDPYKEGLVGRPVNLYSWKANQRFDWTQLIPAVSVYAGANLALRGNPYLHPDDSQISPKLAIITQNNWSGGWVFVMNLIWDKIAEEHPTYAGIATLTHSFNTKFAVFGEFHGIINDLYSDQIVRGGFAYLFHKNFQVDVSGLFNFKDTPSRWQVELGLSYRLDMHEKDEYLGKKEELLK